MPKLGAAGQPYARSCKPKVAKIGALPDPELVYESVMARGKFKKNPNNVSSILWYWATIIIHGMSTILKDTGSVADSVWQISSGPTSRMATSTMRLPTSTSRPCMGAPRRHRTASARSKTAC